ncbi:helix-turn-helix domain-containing protein [Thermomonospora amylolytica]|uniref:Transcriptional regulator GlxA family with amidase domain n=1 Tax=Thermomonospora cellulosilytica TaxID=1411118 RepID=A0A7W3MZX2_9ACTN|nr:transcriptional regulator GlxA family with amidase domain [Thermomonospora cellulosilytica]
MLDGRRATTHWRWADAFTARYPRVRLEPDVLFVDDGNVLTSAGSAAALDLCLHLVRRDHGAEIANAVSRRLVFAAHRDGGQRQFIERPVPSVPDDSLTPLLDWARERLDRPLTVADLAARAAMSPATLHRRFRDRLGTTPLAWLTAERVALACRLIERGERRLDLVARASGLGTAANLRAKMHRHTGLNPTAYRRRFGGG